MGRPAQPPVQRPGCAQDTLAIAVTVGAIVTVIVYFGGLL